jgi:hypothetical protein
VAAQQGGRPPRPHSNAINLRIPQNGARSSYGSPPLQRGCSTLQAGERPPRGGRAGGGVECGEAAARCSADWLHRMHALVDSETQILIHLNPAECGIVSVG